MKNFVKVNLSTTFPLKSRCKYCEGEPKYYYLARTSSAFQDYEVVKFINSWISSNHKRMCQDYYLTEKPRNYNTSRHFSHAVDYKGYSPKYHKNHKNHNLHAMANSIDHLSCECGLTDWAFNETVSKSRPEVSQRKARFVFQTKYTY